MPLPHDGIAAVRTYVPEPGDAIIRWVRVDSCRRQLQQPKTMVREKAPRSVKRLLGVRREVWLIGLLAATYANFYFMDVMVEIQTLPSLVIFAPPSPHDSVPRFRILRRSVVALPTLQSAPTLPD
jgi:hypothetical protein